MTESAPSFDNLQRGHVVLAPDPFKLDDDATRPWVVVNNEKHPFDKQQYVAMGMTTKTWHDERIPLDEDDYIHRQAPEDSSILPHSVVSVQPKLMTDYICRIRDGVLNKAVDEVMSYLRP